MTVSVVPRTSRPAQLPGSCRVLGAEAVSDGVCGPQDVLAGLLLGVLVLCGLILPYIDAVDEYLVTNSYSPITLSVLIALSVLLYPAGNTWTPARSVPRR